jgi:peroxiredoxin
MVAAGDMAPDVEVIDLEGKAVRLSEHWGAGLTALVFMRHVGCVFCREQVKELRDNAGALERAGLSVVTLTPDRPARTRKFVEEYRVPFPTLCDPGRNAYAAYGLTEGTAGQLISPRIVLRGIEATAKGNLPRRPGDNPRQLPGVAIVDGAGRLRHVQRARDASDHLDSRALIALAASLAASTAGLPAR